jgi:hypothetical protein
MIDGVAQDVVQIQAQVSSLSKDGAAHEMPHVLCRLIRRVSVGTSVAHSSV